MKKEVEKTEAGEQMPLIDTVPENIKPIIPWCRKYYKAIRVRLAAEKTEIELKTKIRDMATAAEIPRQSDGTLKFEWEEVKVVITPRDELVKVTIKKDE